MEAKRHHTEATSNTTEELATSATPPHLKGGGRGTGDHHTSTKAEALATSAHTETTTTTATSEAVEV